MVEALVGFVIGIFIPDKFAAPAKVVFLKLFDRVKKALSEVMARVDGANESLSRRQSSEPTPIPEPTPDSMVDNPAPDTDPMVDNTPPIPEPAPTIPTEPDVDLDTDITDNTDTGKEDAR